MPYATIHNEGGTISKKETTRNVHFDVDLTTGRHRFATHKKSNMIYNNMKFKAHDIKMPKRQFVGQTNELTEKQRRLIDSEIRKVWQG